MWTRRVGVNPWSSPLYTRRRTEMREDVLSKVISDECSTRTEDSIASLPQPRHPPAPHAPTAPRSGVVNVEAPRTEQHTEEPHGVCEGRAVRGRRGGTRSSQSSQQGLRWATARTHIERGGGRSALGTAECYRQRCARPRRDGRGNMPRSRGTQANRRRVRRDRNARTASSCGHSSQR